MEFVAKRAGLHTAAGAAKTRAWLREALSGVCDDAPFRHPRPLAVETFCVELFDEYEDGVVEAVDSFYARLLYTSPSPRDATLSRMPSSA